MEQWFNLLFQVSKPILTTLVCAGTSSFLSTIQEELNNEQKHQTKKMLNSLGIKEQQFRELQDLIENFTSVTNLVDFDLEQQFWQEEKGQKEQLVVDQNQTLLELIAKARETTVQSPEIPETLEHWPLRLLPAQLQESCSPDAPIPLRIFLVPPTTPFKGFEQISLETREIEQKLAQGLREFLSQHYSPHSQVRPTDFLGGAGESQNFHGEASIKALFKILKHQPTLILESEIEGETLNFRLAYWGLGQEKYCYLTIFRLSYRDLIEDSVKARALKWKVTRDKLLALGKSLEEVTSLGGDRAINLAILEQAEELQAAGINIKELTFEYQVNTKDFEALSLFFSICHCLVAGWMADIYHLIHYDCAPLLPQLLPQLAKDLSEPKSLQAVLGATVSIYQSVLPALASQRPYWLPILALKFAQSLAHLPDKSLAIEQLNYSLQTWLEQRQLSPSEGIQDLAKIQLALTLKDREYLEILKACWVDLGNEQEFARVESLLNIPPKLNNQQQDSQLGNFILSHTLTKLPEQVTSLALSTDGETLISNGDRRIIEVRSLDPRCWQVSVTQKLVGHSGEVLTFTLSPDSNILASSDRTAQRSYIKIWDLQNRKLHRTLFGHKQPIRSLAISSWQQGSDRQLVASGSHKIKLWDLQTGEPVQTLFGHREWVRSLAISSDTKILISGSEDTTIRIWDLATGDLIRTLTEHRGGVRCVAISPDEQRLISASEDRTIKLWDLKTGKLLHTFTGHLGAVRAVAISRNNQHLISGSEDKTIKVWHFQTGEMLQTLTGHAAAVNALAISPDGQTLVSGGADKTLKIWRTI